MYCFWYWVILLIFLFKASICISLIDLVLNRVSRQAIQRLGAKQDGILRHHKIMRDGRIRDTVVIAFKTRMETGKRNSNGKIVQV